MNISQNRDLIGKYFRKKNKNYIFKKITYKKKFPMQHSSGIRCIRHVGDSFFRRISDIGNYVLSMHQRRR